MKLKLLFTLFLISFSFNSSAESLTKVFSSKLNNIENKVLTCSPKSIKKIVLQIKQIPGYDKFKHCAVSCLVTFHCGQTLAFWLGALKEIKDMVTGIGAPEWKDMEANSWGISFGEIIGHKEECIRLCKHQFPRKHRR